MPSSKGRQCCGFIPMKTGVSLITIIGILNKLSGFYGILSFDYTDKLATAVFIYSLITLVIFSYALYGLYTDNIRILRWYTMLFWIDCLISTITTVWFAVSWFVYTDHNLPESADNPGKMAEHDIVFKLESRVSIAVLIVLRLIHFYFAYVVTRYYKAITQISYSRLVASDNIDLEDTSFSNKDASTSESAFKPAQD